MESIIGAFNLNCHNCDKLHHVDDTMPNDHGMCSLECGYKIRGLSPWDFF